MEIIKVTLDSNIFISAIKGSEPFSSICKDICVHPSRLIRRKIWQVKN